MRRLKILIFPLGNNVDSLNQMFAALYSRYGVEQLDIAGVVGESKLFIRGKAMNNIPFEKVPATSFDYLIAVGGGLELNNYPLSTLRRILADKIKVPLESLLFDFEIYRETFRFPKVCLVVIFNHRFDRNLPLLRKIYGERFSEIRFLIPFYDGTDTDVIPVYESSYRFQGYLIQAYEKLKDIPCTHYLFIGDDLIIAPEFDEINFPARLNMYGQKSLFMAFKPLNNPNAFRWHWTINSSKPFFDYFTSWRGSLYSYDEAMSKFNAFFGTPYKETYNEAFFGNPNEPGSNMLGRWNNPRDFLNVVNHFIMTNGNSLKIPYPMAFRGCSADFFCTDKTNLFDFSRLCGIFSAMNMFVEIAVPTAAVLTYKRDEVKFFPRESCLILWKEERTALEEKYDRNFNRFYNDWNEKFICVHPVKLSGWKMD